MRPALFWREMPSSAFGDHAKDWIAVLPIAAIEQHGPHLPVGVDAIIAEGMVARVAKALPDDLPVTFLPVEEVCKSNEHIAFPGTLTLDWDVVIRTWVQIGESVARAGVRTLVIVTSHGGNVAPMEVAARELRQRLGMRAVTTAWGRLGCAAPKSEGVFIDIHAGQAETSWMLAMRPDLVDMSKAEDFRSAQEQVVDGSGRLGYHMMGANMAWLSQDLNPKGVVGNAAAATAEAGEADIAAMVEGFVALMRDLSRVPPP
jgi:creatinine amidohydrolase